MSLDAISKNLASQVDFDVGDDTTNVNAPAVGGTAAAPSVADLFDGGSPFGPDASDAAGVWRFTPITLADGADGFPATAMEWSGGSSAAGAAVIIGLDTAAPSSFTVNAAPPVMVADGATAAIDGASAQSVIFAGPTGTLVLDEATAFKGEVLGLTGSDALDLTDVSYGSSTTATFSGNATGGTLTVTNGTETAHIALVGDYLTSGWTLSSDGHGGTVVVDPPLSGSVFPNATNTGVPAGVALKPSGSLTLSTAGQVVSGLDISGTVYITASNVTLENCVIESNGYYVIEVAPGVTGVVIQDCEIDGMGLNGSAGSSGIFVEGSGVSIIGCNIHDAADGVSIGGGTAPVVIEDDYIHNLLAPTTTNHYNGIQYNGSGDSGAITIENNTIINTQGQTDAVMIDNYYGSVNNVAINNNLLSGGDYTIYVDGHFNSDPITNVSITNNDLGSGVYGYTDFNETSPVFTANVDDGATLVAALPVSPVVSLASATAGNYSSGNTLTLTLYMSEAVTVGGTPTLTLNDGGTATYTGGTGTNALTFSYTVAAGQNTSALAVTGVTGTITDLDGNALSASSLPATFAGVAVGSSSGPTLTSITQSPSSGDFDAGKTVTLTLTMSEVVTVNTSGGTPTLTLNDGGTATYSSGSGFERADF